MARTIRECSVQDCVGLSGVRGASRGYCAKHYQRWRKWGDPLKVRQLGRPPCTVDGCDKPSAGRGWCTTHYMNWRNHGEPVPRKRGEIVNGHKICPRCEADLPVEQFGPSAHLPQGLQTYCRPCARANTKEYRAANPGYVPPPRDPEAQRMSARGWRQRNPEKARAATAVRRARCVGATVEPVVPHDVFERDGWCCGICSEQIDSKVQYPDPLSASLDHVVPLARGGAHSMANCQAAHLVCNLRKHAKLIGV